MALTFSIWNNILTMERGLPSITMRDISRRQEGAIGARRVRCRRHFVHLQREIRLDTRAPFYPLVGAGL